MMRIGSALLFSVAMVALLVGGACDKGKKDKAGGAPPVAQKDGAEGLKAFFEQSHAACTSKDFAKGKALVMSVIPNKDQLKKVLKDDVPADQLDKLTDQYKELPPSDEKAACIFYPGDGRTEIKVHASSVEDLIAYKEGTPSFEEFPGGAKKLAEKVLKPGNTFYEVEVTEPGKDQGTKYHMFFWDGSQWRMMGPAWRVLKSE
ncbi:MAG TPA: hypothetical protein VIV40_11900 [Kofleriaceae bacterium]